MANFIHKSMEQLKTELTEYLRLGKRKIQRLRIEWDMCRDMYQGITGHTQGGVDSSVVTALLAQSANDIDQEIALDTAKLAVMTLFMQSKLTLSEPSTVAKAYTADEADHNAARYAQLVIEHLKNGTSLKPVVEKDFNLNVSSIGLGVLYIGWDPDGGTRVIDAPEDFNPLEDDFTMEGDYEYRSVSPYNFIMDPTCTDFNVDGKNCAELRKIPLDAIIHKVRKKMLEYGADEEEIEEKIESLKDYSKTCKNMEFAGKIPDDNEEADKAAPYVLLWEYWEKAEPWNGLLGRYVLFTNTEDFEGGEIDIIFAEAHPYDHKRCPFAVLTDMDIADDPAGMSRMVLAMPMANTMSQMFSHVLANIELHGHIKMLVPEGSMSKEYLSDAPFKPIEYNSALGDKPGLLAPTQVTSDIWRLHTLLEKEIDALYGANEFSRGEIPRELSSFAVSLAVERDDQFRIRIFNKKKECIKILYQQSLWLTQQYVTEDRMFLIAGDSNSWSFEYFNGNKLLGKYGVFVSYGLYQPTDPHAQKDQLLEVYKLGMYEKAGGNVKRLVTSLVDGDMLELRDMFEAATVIQKQETVRMINGEEVAVQEWHEHNAHYEELARYMNTMEFERLDEETQQRVLTHSQQHAQAIAQLKAKAAQAGGQPQGGQPQQGPTMQQAQQQEGGLMGALGTMVSPQGNQGQVGQTLRS